MFGVLTGMMAAAGPGAPGGDSIWPHMFSILRRLRTDEPPD